jgi:hypothetical protein
VPTNEKPLDATYKVYHLDVNRIIPLDHDHDFDGREKRNYIEATKLAIQWIKKYPIIFIIDASAQVIGVDSNGVTLINSNFNHSHHQEHLKLKEELEKAWTEHRNKYL